MPNTDEPGVEGNNGLKEAKVPSRCGFHPGEGAGPIELICLVLTGTLLEDFSYHIGNVIIPTDFHSIIFQRGRSTTNQCLDSH